MIVNWSNGTTQDISNVQVSLASVASGGADATLIATANTVTITAPTVPAVHLTMPIDRLQSRYSLASLMLDSFNRANETPLASPWAAVSTNYHSVLLQSNQAVGYNDGNDSHAYWTTTQFAADQEAYFTHISGTGYSGVILRLQNEGTASANFYFVGPRALTGQFAVYKNMASSWTQLGVDVGDHTGVEAYGARIVGTTISVWTRTSSVWTKIYEIDDSSITGAGYIGFGFASFGEPIGDNFGGGAVAAFGDSTVTISAPAQTELHAITLAAGANTVTVSAPTVPSLALTMPQDANIITITAPAQTELHAISLAAGSQTIIVTAPDATGVFGGGGVTLDAGENTITISAPAQSQLVEITLAAGANTVTVSAPTVPSLALTMPQDANIITISAPAQSQLVEITLAAGANTVAVSAPAQSQLVELSLAAGSNTVTTSAPSQSQLVEIALAAGSNTVAVTAPTVPSLTLTMPQSTNLITISAPDADISIDGGDQSRQAGQNTVTITAPTVAAIHVSVPADTNVVTLTAPSVQVNVSVPADANIITLTAPTALPQTAVTLIATVNTLTVIAPTASIETVGGPQTLSATGNTVTVTARPAIIIIDQFMEAATNVLLITAPDTTMTLTFDSLLEAGANQILITAPIMTFNPQYFGVVKMRHEARITHQRAHTVAPPVLTERESTMNLVVSSTEDMVE